MIPSWRIGRSLRPQAGGWEAGPWQDARTLLARLRDRDASLTSSRTAPSVAAAAVHP